MGILRDYSPHFPFRILASRDTKMNLTKLTFVLFFLAVANASVLNLEEIKRIIADAERELSAENDNVETSEKREESLSPRKIERYGYENELNPAVEAAQGVEEAAEGVLAQLEGLATNFQVYGEKAMEVFGVALKDYVKAIRVFVVATPAKAVKTLAVGMLKTTKNLLVSIGALYKDYNPLHPLKSADHLGRLKPGYRLDDDGCSCSKDLCTIANGCCKHN